ANGDPEFRSRGQPAFREAALGQLVYSGVAKPAESTPSGNSSGARHHEAEENRTSDRKNAADVASIQQSCRRQHSRCVPSGGAFRTRGADSEAICFRKELPRNCEEPPNQPSNPAQSPSPHQPEAADSQSPGSGNA